MLRSRLLFLLLVFFAHGLFFAQGLEFEKYTTKNGLPSNNVYNIYQDHKGYLWVFTQYGAVKFNGSSFEPVLKNLPFEESFIYSFYENREGRKWIANSNAKIYEVINDSAYIVKGTEKVSEELRASVSEVFQLYADDSLNIYAITKATSYKFIKKDHYKPINLSARSVNNVLGYTVLCEKNTLMAVSSDLFRDTYPKGFFNSAKTMDIVFKSDTGTTRFQLDCYNTFISPKVFKKYGNSIYIGFYDKIVKVHADQTSEEIPIGSVISNFTRDNNGHIWVSCFNNGLYELNEKDSVINHYFEGKTVNDALIDSQNNLWVSTAGFGLYHCRNLNLTRYDESDPLGSSLSFIRPIDNKLLIANTRGDLFMSEGKGLRLIKKRDDGHFEPMDITKEGALFTIAYRHKIEYFHPEKGVVKTVFPYKEFYVCFKYLKLEDGSLLAIGKKSILFLSGEKTGQKFIFNCKVFDGAERNGRLLVATENGVFELVNGELIPQPYLSPTKNIYVSRIVADRHHNYWLCTRGNGLYKLLPDNRMLNYNLSNGLPAIIINDIYFKDSSMVLSTSKGAFYSGSGDMRNWTDLYPEEVSEVCYFDQRLYLSSQNGLVIIDDKGLDNKPSLYFHLISVNVNSKRIKNEQLSHLRYNENNLELVFDIILFSESRKALKYKLTSDNLNYSTSTQDNKISLRDLSPGTYTLSVVPDTRIRSDAEIKLVFTIHPAFWQTTWFLILFSLCFVGITILVVLAVIKRKRKKELKRNETDKLILEYKLIALKAQINPHFMSNCLMAIQHMIYNNKLHEANLYIAKFSFLVRQVLNFSSRSLVKLSEELEITKLNMELEQLRFEKKFDFKIHLGDSIEVNELLVPPLILQPIVENAIWHGLLPLKDKRTGTLYISMFIERDMLCITIEDNGVGRSKSKETIHNSKDSKGIRITKQRISNINNLYGVTGSDLLYEDLIGEDGQGQGTLVKLVLPILNKF